MSKIPLMRRVEDDKRSHKKQERLAPDEDPELAFSVQGRGKRWSEKTVILLSVLMSKHFSLQQLTSLQSTGKWPLSNAASRVMWQDVTANINAYLDEEDPDKEIDRWSADAGAPWRETARKWFVQLAKKANVSWKQSNPVGWRAEKLHDVLHEMADILVAGFKQADGQVMLFTSLDEATRLVPHFKQLRDDHKLGNSRTLWQYLKHARPSLRFTKQQIKRPRDAADVQVRSLHYMYAVCL